MPTLIKIDIKKLKELYFDKHLSMKKASKIIGCSEHTIQRTFHRIGIKPRKQTPKEQIGKLNTSWKEDLISEKEFRKLYLDEKISLSKIANKYKTDFKPLLRRMVIWGIKKRTQSEAGKLAHPINSKSKQGNRKIYLKLAKDNFKWICDICKRKKTNPNFDLVVHHKNGNNFNNNIENLQILCQICHAKITAKQFEHIRKTGSYKKCDNCNKKIYRRKGSNSFKNFCSYNCYYNFLKKGDYRKNEVGEGK